MKTYQFIKGWMKGGRLDVSSNGTTYMYDEKGKFMNFRQISNWEIQDWLETELIKEI